MNKKAFVLLSGGIDSSTCLFYAIDQWQFVEGVSVDYGQRHHTEIAHARKLCDMHDIRHTILRVQDILGGAMLTDREQKLPKVSYADLPVGVSPTYVPFRNGTLLSLITARAQSWVNTQIDAAISVGATRERAMEMAKDVATILFGAHAEDAHNWAYPDCTAEFTGAMANAIYIGTYGTVRLQTPLQWMTKDRIIRWGTELGVPYGQTWSCYAGEKVHCGVCPTCRARKDGFARAGVADPTEYAN